MSRRGRRQVIDLGPGERPEPPVQQDETPALRTAARQARRVREQRLTRLEHLLDQQQAALRASTTSARRAEHVMVALLPVVNVALLVLGVGPVPLLAVNLLALLVELVALETRRSNPVPGPADVMDRPGRRREDRFDQAELYDR